MVEIKGQNPGPYDSEEILFSAIQKKQKGLGRVEIEIIVDSKHLRFYNDQGLLTTLIEGINTGRIRYDEKTNRMMACSSTLQQ